MTYTTHDLPSDLQQVLTPLVETYWRIVREARYRVPADGYRDEALHDGGGPSDEEALQWAVEFWNAEGGEPDPRYVSGNLLPREPHVPAEASILHHEGWFNLGLPNSEDRPTLVLVTEAAYMLCAMDHERATTLLRMALADLDAKAGQDA